MKWNSKQRLVSAHTCVDRQRDCVDREDIGMLSKTAHPRQSLFPKKNELTQHVHFFEAEESVLLGLCELMFLFEAYVVFFYPFSTHSSLTPLVCVLYTRYWYVHILMKDEKEERKKRAKQHSTTKAVIFPKKNKLPRVGLKPTTLYTLGRALYHVILRSKYNVQVYTCCSV